MDKVFQEEQKQLSKIENRIDLIASRHENKVLELNDEIKDFFCVDYSDIALKKDLIDQRSAEQRAADRYRAYQPSPYFGRLDLDRENGSDLETVIYYVGKESISEGTDYLVHDWRSPVGACYYATTQKTFIIKGYHYDLALRRALNIADQTLISYKTEYDGETVSLDGDVIDPFLLTVLKDKRRHNRLTDIIKTIQSNQNEIIRKPRNESFIVQGCAGSGKTMILLHRLSFLKFNYPNMSFSGVKIITPNKFFDAHINDLSDELGLNEIERFSVEEYYASLIKRYSARMTADANVTSEKLLNADMLEEVYSQEYMSESIAHYHEYWNRVLEQANEGDLRQIFARYHVSYPDTTLHIVDTYERLDAITAQIEKNIEETREKRNLINGRIESLKKEIAALQAETKTANESLYILQGKALSKLINEIEIVRSELEKAEEFSAEQKARKEELTSLLSATEKAAFQTERLLRSASQETEEYSDFDRCAQKNDALAGQVMKACHSLVDIIVTAEKDWQNTPSFHFVKRNNLRKQITTQKERFTHEASRFLQTLQGALEETLEAKKRERASYQEESNALQENLRVVTRQVMALKNKRLAFDECRSVLSTTETPDLQNTLSSSARKECAMLLSDYETQQGICKQFLRRLSNLLRVHTELLEEFKSISNDPSEESDFEFIQKCRSILRGLQMQAVYQNVIDVNLHAKYKAYHQKYQKTNYRHKLYLKLLFCSLYFNRLINADTFLNIDEAQDISVTEYQLLRRILGNQCTFNLYGDINQSVYSYKGILDWNDLDHITGANIYVLNENYRNTLQITSFCNEEFGAEVYAIGISGEPVQELQLEDAVDWLVKYKANNPQDRVAILYRYGVKAIQDKLSSLCEEKSVSWHVVDEKKISILSVETAKGLEFEAIVAITDQMSTNEKYISYTRALDRLVVVRERFAAGFIAEKDEEDGSATHENTSPTARLINTLDLDQEEQVKSMDEQWDTPMDHTVLSNKLYVFLADSDLEILRNELIKQGVLTMAQFQELKLWPFMNMHDLYSIGQRQAICSRLVARMNSNTESKSDENLLPQAPIEQHLVEKPTEASFSSSFQDAEIIQGDAPTSSLPPITEVSIDEQKPSIPIVAEGGILTTLSVSNDLAFCDPIYAEILGKRLCETKNWQHVYMWMLNSLSNANGALFEQAIQKSYPKNGAEHYPRKLENGMTIEAGYSASGLMQKIAVVARNCNVDPQTILVGYKKRDVIPNIKDSSTQTTASIASAAQIQKAEQTILEADLDGMTLDALSQNLNITLTSAKQIVAESTYIVTVEDRLIHTEAFVDWEVGANQLTEILDKLMTKNNGYVSAAQLYSFAQTNMHMFLNDNDINNERAVFDVAQHLFEKTHYNNKHFTFQSKNHISREGEDVHNILDVIKKYAQDHGGVFVFGELEEYLKDVGLKTGNLRGQMRLYDEPIFLFYDDQRLIWTESMNLDENWFSSVSDALERLFDDMGDHVVIRDVHSFWYDQLPSLPQGLCWTPMLVQGVLRFYSKELRARTICALSTQSITTLHAMIVHADSEIQTFCDAVVAYLIDECIDQRQFEAEELRQLLQARGMIAGGELWTKMPKALCNDERFAWDAQEKYVTIKV